MSVLLGKWGWEAPKSSQVDLRKEEASHSEALSRREEEGWLLDGSIKWHRTGRESLPGNPSVSSTGKLFRKLRKIVASPDCPPKAEKSYMH